MMEIYILTWLTKGEAKVWQYIKDELEAQALVLVRQKHRI
jgi:hypothetical protein